MSDKLFRTLTIGGVTYTLNDTTKLEKPDNVGVIGQVLTKTADGTTWSNPTSVSQSYNNLTDKPKINGQELVGNITITTGGANYTDGDGIIIDNDTISVDFDAVARKSDIIKYTPGDGIKIENNVISCTASGGSTDIPQFCTVQSYDESAGTVVVLAEDGHTYTLRYKEN